MVNLSFYSVKLVKESASRYDIEKSICKPESAVEIFRTIGLHEESEEKLMMLTLNIKNKVIGVFTVSQGSLNSSIVHPREIFKRAILNNAAGIIIAHNHPSGDPTPSQEDINVTRRIIDAGKILGIDLLDHVILGDNRYISLKEEGKI